MIVNNDEARLRQLRTIISAACESQAIDQVAVNFNGSEEDFPTFYKIAKAWKEELPEGFFSWVVTPWENSFAVHRNQAWHLLTTRHAMWLDTDDDVPDFAAYRAAAEAFTDTDIAGIATKYVYSQGEFGDAYVQTRERLALDANTWCWYGRVHESLMQSSRADKAMHVDYSDHLKVVHHGTNDSGKMERNMFLLQLELEQGDLGKSVKLRLRNAFYTVSALLSAQEWVKGVDYYLNYISLMFEGSEALKESPLISRKIALAVFTCATEAAKHSLLPAKKDMYLRIADSVIDLAITQLEPSNELYGAKCLQALEVGDAESFYSALGNLTTQPTTYDDVNTAFYDSFRWGVEALWLIRHETRDENMMQQLLSVLTFALGNCEAIGPHLHSAILQAKQLLKDTRTGIFYVSPTLFSPDAPKGLFEAHLGTVNSMSSVLAAMDVYSNMIPSSSPFSLSFAWGGVLIAFVHIADLEGPNGMQFLVEPVDHNVPKFMLVLGGQIHDESVDEAPHVPGWSVLNLPSRGFSAQEWADKADSELGPHDFSTLSYQLMIENVIASISVTSGAPYPVEAMALESRAVSDMEMQRDFIHGRALNTFPKQWQTAQYTLADPNKALMMFDMDSKFPFVAVTAGESEGDKDIPTQVKLGYADANTAVISGNTIKHLDLLCNSAMVFYDTEGRPRRLGLGADNNLPTLTKKRRLVFYCETGTEDWGPMSPYQRGIGASESSLIYLAAEMAKLQEQDGSLSFEVVVFCPVAERMWHNGVLYMPLRAFSDEGAHHVIISRRLPEWVGTIKAPVTWWIHDVTPEDVIRKILQETNVSAVVAPSKFAVLGNPDIDGLRFIDNPVFPHAGFVPRGVAGNWLGCLSTQPFHLITSQPERCLEGSLEFEPDVRKVVTYGYDNYLTYHNHSLAAYNTVHKWRKQIVKHKAVQLGRVSAWCVQYLLSQATAWIYISKGQGFRETYCVAAKEATIAGCPVIVKVGDNNEPKAILSTWEAPAFWATREVHDFANGSFSLVSEMGAEMVTIPVRDAYEAQTSVDGKFRHAVDFSRRHNRAAAENWLRVVMTSNRSISVASPEGTQDEQPK